mmetsp:Transcript_19141/g.49092  ORF Transcript_19141/g.49092 Transcript_19141/m.49092 type:complete len:479 (+) Transcript_19141:160-1596(+)
MYPSPGTVKNPSYQVKNTFLEFPIPEDDGGAYKRRSRSDFAVQGDIRHSPLVVASKSPNCSPLLQPVDETKMAMPIDDVNFELLEEAVDPDAVDGEVRTRLPSDPNMPTAQAAGNVGRNEPAYVVASSPYIVPTTPSPFLHSMVAPSVVPPFGGYGFDLGLPPAFGDGSAEACDGYGEMDPNNYMQGMQFLPESYDPSYGYMPYGWAAMPSEGDGSNGVAFGEGMQDIMPDGMSGAMASVGADGSAAQDRPAKEGRSRGGKGRNKVKEGEMEEKSKGASEKDAWGAGASAASGDAAAERSERKRDKEKADRKEAKEDVEDPEIPANYTTVMLRNIPNKYTREMLIKQLSLEFLGQFDFMYLPIDFKNKCNVGYGFINFRTPDACSRFVSQFHGVDVRKCLPGLNSKKVVEVTPARVQGLSENVRRLRNSPVMNQLMDHPEWMPLLFSKQGEEEPFPQPDAPLPPVKPRGRNREAAPGA